MSIASWQLYDLDACEQEFKRILVAAIPGVQIQAQREGDANTTPRIAVLLDTQQTQGQRHILNPNQLVQFQPLNTWMYSLGVSVYTNRSENGSQHAELVAKCREQMQMWKLNLTWTQEVFTVVEIVEQPAAQTIEDVNNFDVTTLTFSGMLSIREQAWSDVA